MTSTDVGLIAAASIQAVATIVLVVVTISYAIFTKKQAKANEKMADEMKKQTDATIRPMIIARYCRSGYGKERKHLEIDFDVLNVGKGAALNIRAQMKLPDGTVKTLPVICTIRNAVFNNESQGQEQTGYLAPDESIRYRFSHILTDSPSIEAQLILLYQDMINIERNHEWLCFFAVKWQYMAGNVAPIEDVHFIKLERIEQ